MLKIRYVQVHMKEQTKMILVDTGNGEIVG